MTLMSAKSAKNARLSGSFMCTIALAVWSKTLLCFWKIIIKIQSNISNKHTIIIAYTSRFHPWLDSIGFVLMLESPRQLVI